VDPFCPHLPSLSFRALWRYQLRQEPSALVAHAGICAGGAGKPAFLPRHKFFAPALFRYHNVTNTVAKIQRIKESGHDLSIT
jgi:hypothetical protein